MLHLQSVSAVVWSVQEASVHDKLEDLLVGQALVRLLCQRADLPQDNPKRPGKPSDKDNKSNTGRMRTGQLDTPQSKSVCKHLKQ